MKILHIADTHFQSSCSTLLELKDERKELIYKTFKDVIKKESINGYKVVLLAGDIFDKDVISDYDITYFTNVINDNKDIEFFYLRGNHDLKNKENFKSLKNLHMFDSQLTTYETSDVRISGIELDKDNIDNFYDSINFSNDKYNILMLHGDIDNEINLNKLKDKNINYLALGHIHTFKEVEFDINSKYVYPGVFLGRGFDECGAKGYVRLDTMDSSVTFVKSSENIIKEITVDCNTCQNVNDLYKLILDKEESNTNLILRINLVGETKISNIDFVKNLSLLLDNNFNFVSIKDNTYPYINIDEIKDSKSFEGEFVREVLKTDNDQKTKQKIISTGLKALRGMDI